MAEFVLKPRSALGGYAREWADASLVEVEGRALVSVAARRDMAERLAERAAAVGLSLPGPGRFAVEDAIAVYWMGPEQWFVASDEDAAQGLRARLSAAFGDAASLTEQSDAWVQFHLSGPGATKALERFCPLDLGAFPAGSVGRTVMEHLGAVIAREDDSPTFLLMTARSSARSFLHALEAVLDSALG